MNAKMVLGDCRDKHTRRKMKIWASTEISEEANREMRKISARTGKKMMFLYREAIEEYAEKHKVATVEQPV